MGGLDGLLPSKFIIVAPLCGGFDNDQSPMAGINGEWHFNNFSQMTAI
jgi:hypothetical protein